MPKAQTKFCSAWLELIDVNNQRVVQWCRQGKDKFHGYCRYCDSDIRCDNSGKAQILQHAKKEKHRHAIKYVQDDTQGKLLFCASTWRTVDSAESSSGKLRVLNYNDAHLSAEIYWLAKVAVSNYSLRSVDRKGLQTYGKELEQLCVDVHSLFKYSAARREDYQDLQRKMDVSLNAFQQHIEVRWLSLGPALCRLLEQWDCICQFLKDLGKDEKTAPKNVNYKRAAATLTTDDNKVIRVQLEFLKTCTPVFEELLTLFQKSSPTIHLVYDSMCDTLLKLMRRFMKSEALKGKHGPDLACVSIRDRSRQLSDKELVIGDGTKKALASLKPEKQ